MELTMLPPIVAPGTNVSSKDSVNDLAANCRTCAEYSGVSQFFAEFLA